MKKSTASSTDDLFDAFEGAASPQPQDAMVARAAQVRAGNAPAGKRGVSVQSRTKQSPQSRQARPQQPSNMGRAMATNLPSANSPSDAMARRQQALRAQQAAAAAQAQAQAEQQYQQEMQARADIIEHGTARQRRRLRRQDRQAEKAAGIKGPGIVERFRDFFDEHPPSEAYDTFMEWMRYHSVASLLIGVAFIAIGLLFNRYISFAGAIVLLALGWLVGRTDDDYDPYIFYIAALFTFVIPYLF